METLESVGALGAGTDTTVRSRQQCLDGALMRKLRQAHCKCVRGTDPWYS